MSASRSSPLSRNILVGTAVLIAVSVGLGKLLGPPIRLAAHQHGQVREMPGVIRGSVDPKVIPDEIAYSMLFRMLARGDAGTLRYRQNAAYIRYRMGLKGGDCLDTSAYPESPGLPRVVFKSDRARDPACSAGERFVTYHERLVRLARRYESAIEPVEAQVSAAPLAAHRNQAAQRNRPIDSGVVASLTLARRARLADALADLDPVLGIPVATQVRQFVTKEMKKKMSVRAANRGGMK